eukprot:CFRG7127T1
MSEANKVEGESNTESFEGHYIVLAVTFIVFWGVIVRNVWSNQNVKKWIPLPYTVIMLLVGLGWGLIYEASGEEHGDLGSLSIAFSYLVEIHPDIILYVFIPALVFESAYAINHHTFRVVFTNALLVATVGVVITIGLTATLAYYAFGYDWNWLTCLLFASILAATDPVAVVALLRELGVSERLSTLIEGESLLNDGSAFVCFLLFLEQLTGANRDATQFFTFTLQLALGGPAMGMAFAIMTIILLDLTFFDDILEVSITIIAPYLCFWTAEEAEVSSVLAVVFLGLIVGLFGKAMLSSLETEEYIHRVWELISWWANTLLFAITGFVLADRVFFNGGGIIGGRDVGNLFILYVALHLIRALSILVLMPVLRLNGYGLDWKQFVVMVYGGLRGAIGLALALIVESDPEVPLESRTRIMFLVGGIVGLTLLINGSTTQYLLSYLGMGEVTAERYQILDNIIDHTQEVVYENIHTLQSDPFYQGSDWIAVTEHLDLDNFYVDRKVAKRKYENVLVDPCVPMHGGESLNDVEKSMDGHSHMDELSSRLQRRELRCLFLSSLKSIFTRYFYEERILNTWAYNSLMNGLNRVGDTDTDSLANLWEKSRDTMNRPALFRKFRHVWGLGWLTQRLTYYYLTCYLQKCVAFIQALREARIVLENAEDSVQSPLHGEIEDITKQAHVDMIAITRWAPEVLTSLQTHHSVFHILKQLLHEIEEGLEEGILEMSEYENYRNLIYSRIRKLKRAALYHPDSSTDRDILDSFGSLRPFANEFYRLQLNDHKVFFDVGESVSVKSKDKSIFIILRGVCRWTQLEYEAAPQLGEVTECDQKKADKGFERLYPNFKSNARLSEVVKAVDMVPSTPTAANEPIPSVPNELKDEDVMTVEASPMSGAETVMKTSEVKDDEMAAHGSEFASETSRSSLRSKRSEHRFRWEIEGDKPIDDTNAADASERLSSDGVHERQIFGSGGAVVGDVGTLTNRGDMKEVEAISLVEAIQLTKEMIKEICTNPSFREVEVALWRSIATKTVNHHLRRVLEGNTDLETIRECINVSSIVKGNEENVNEIFPLNCGSENILLLRGHATIRVLPQDGDRDYDEDDATGATASVDKLEAIGAGLHKVVAPNMIFAHTLIAFVSEDAILMPLEATEKRTVSHRLMKMATHDMRGRPSAVERRGSVTLRKSLARTRTGKGYAARASEPAFAAGGYSTTDMRRRSIDTGMSTRARGSGASSGSGQPSGATLIRMKSHGASPSPYRKGGNTLAPRSSLSHPSLSRRQGASPTGPTSIE